MYKNSGEKIIWGKMVPIASLSRSSRLSIRAEAESVFGPLRCMGNSSDALEEVHRYGGIFSKNGRRFDHTRQDFPWRLV